MANTEGTATDGGSPASSKSASREMTPGTFIAWAFLLVMLVALSEFPATGDLAAAFALLILIAVSLGFGPTAFSNIANLVQGA